MSEIRFDLLHNRYTIIAPERLHRPDLFEAEKTKSLSSKKCPFCEGNEALTPDEIFAIRENGANSTGWKTRVVPNLYKALSVEESYSSKRDGMSEKFLGVGAHEVLIDSPSHEKDILKESSELTKFWLQTLKSRVNDLKNDIRLVHLSIFKNHGLNAGATQKHPHTQLLALPILPQSELDFLKQNFKYYKKHGRGIQEDLLQSELDYKERILDKTDDFTAYCPYASSFPFEVIISPNKNISTIAQCSEKNLEDLSTIITSVFDKLYLKLGNFDYNLYFKIAPLNSNFQNESYLNTIEKNFRFSLRIVPRIYRLAGFELANDMFINPISPEECAKVLRREV